MTISLLLRGPQGRGIFDDIPEEKLPKDMLDLAKHIVDSKKAEWKPERFEDQYEDALKELLKRKQSGQKIEAPRDREPSKVVNLMDSLRRFCRNRARGWRATKASATSG
jgi:DNA end-binding protein Ku